MEKKAIDDDEVILDFASIEESLHSLSDVGEVKTELFSTEDVSEPSKGEIKIEDREWGEEWGEECEDDRPSRSTTLNKKLCECVIRDIECQHTKKGLVCNYAHSIEELVPDVCKHGKECYRITFSERYGFENKGRILCRLIHDKENFDNYIWRIGYDKFENINIPKFNPKNSTSSAPIGSPCSTSSERKRGREEQKSSSRPLKKSKYLPKKDGKKENGVKLNGVKLNGVKLDKKESYNPAKKAPYTSRSSTFKSGGASDSSSVDLKPKRVTLTVPASHYREAISIALEKGIDNVRIRIQEDDEDDI
jgi:hypothetical protein